MSSPTQRTKKYFKDLGWEIDIVERWIGVGLPNKFMGSRKKRVDYCGFADLIAFNLFYEIAIQTTSTSNAPARVTKIKTEEKPQRAAIEWLLGGCSHCGKRGRRLILVQGWKKYATRVNNKYWRPKHYWVTLDDYPDAMVFQVEKEMEAAAIQTQALIDESVKAFVKDFPDSSA